MTYWVLADAPPTGEDPLGALIVRLAAASEEPQLLTFHLDDVGAAAGRATDLVDPNSGSGHGAGNARSDVLSGCRWKRITSVGRHERLSVPPWRLNG